MKKKIFGIAVVAIVAIAATRNVSENKNGTNLINLTLDNVEALAEGESSGNHGPTEVSWWSGRYCKNTNNIGCNY